jgi:hypothetical protein
MGQQRVEERLAAEHMLQVADAAKLYVRKHGATLTPTPTASTGPTIALATLRTENFLKSNFPDTNPWGQTYGVYVRKPAVDGELLRIVVVTSGGPAKKKQWMNTVVPHTAALMGAAGGYAPTGDIPSMPVGSLQGAGNIWRIPFTTLGIPDPGPGHLGYVSDYDSSDLAAEYLYRVEVPGNPDLNAMQVSLDMKEHSIDNVKDLQFTEREITTETCTAPEDQGRTFLDREKGLYLCRNGSQEMISDTGNATSVKDVLVVTPGTVVEKPVCAVETNSAPHIYMSPSIAALGPEAPPINAFQTWAEDTSDTQWTVRMRVLVGKKNATVGGVVTDAEGWGIPPANYARITAITTCAKEALP